MTDVRLVRADKSNAVIHERERSRRGEKLRPGDDVEAEGLHYGVRYAD